MSLCDSILVKYGTTLCNLFKNNYFRFLDDILIILDVKQLPVSDLSVILNCLATDLNFTIESFGTTVNFLDVRITAPNSKIETDIYYYKPTGSKKYLNYHSHHPRHAH